MQETVVTSTSFFTKENITFLIAVVGFLLSVAQLLFSLWKKRYNLKISNTGYYLVTSEYNPNLREYVFGFFVENLSSNPINIIYLKAQCRNGSYHRCLLTHRFFKEHFLPFGTDRTYQFFTSDFPIHLDGNTSKLIFVMFSCPNNEQILFSDTGDVIFNVKCDIKNSFFTISCTQTSNFLNQQHYFLV